MKVALSKHIFQKFASVLTAIALTSVLVSAGPDDNLPETEILGNRYRYHVVAKGESIYGIANRYGWDIDKLRNLNPKISELKKGMRLYYPVENASESETAHAQEAATKDVGPFLHEVKRGETVYSVSRRYGITPDDIYDLNPGTKYGIKAGQSLQIPQGGNNSKYLFYRIKPGDTLYSLAKKHDTSIAVIMGANPGVTENNFQAGETIRIPSAPEPLPTTTETVEEEKLTGIDSYKVGKNDTWKSISRKTGIDESLLREANPTSGRLEKDNFINIPVIERVEVEKTLTARDPRETTVGGIEEIYDSIHKTISSTEEPVEIRFALLLDEPSSRKDIDFCRGVLLALDDMKEVPYKISFKTFDGRGASSALAADLEDFSPQLIVSTAEKAFPAFLAGYGEDHNATVVNAFDVKSDLYEESPAMVQVLSPSSVFNDQAASSILNRYDNCRFIMVGPKDEGDAIGELIEEYNGNDAGLIPAEALASYPVSESGKYVVYAYTQKRDEIKEILDNVSRLKEEFPLAEFTVIGRPSWITLTENLKGHSKHTEIIIPARCWLDTESDKGKKFIDSFSETFDCAPLNSFPNFAASGYDIARYFIDSLAVNRGDFNEVEQSGYAGLQTDFELTRTGNWSGLLNNTNYIVELRPFGQAKKEKTR